MYDHVCMPNHANAFAQQQVSDMWHIQVSGAGAALAAMKDVEKVKDLEEKILQVCGNSPKTCFFFQLQTIEILGYPMSTHMRRLLLLEMQLQMCSIQVCCLKPSEQTVQIDIQDFSDVQCKLWSFLFKEEIELDFHPMRIENISIGQELRIILNWLRTFAWERGGNFEELRESWSENKTHTAVQNIRRDSPRTGDNLQIFTGSIGFNASLLQEAWTFAPQIDMRVIRHILRYPQRSGSRTGISFAMSLPRFVIFHHVSSFLAHLMCMFDHFCPPPNVPRHVVVEQLTGGDPRRGRAAPHEVNEAIFKG